jgi:transaldolase
MNKLDQLKTMTDVVADTGDIGAIAEYKPVDATTNPSLLLKAAGMPQYDGQLAIAKNWAKAEGGSSEQMRQNFTDKLAVDIGTEILAIVPGRVSSEVDARLSFDTVKTIEKANRLISLYEGNDIGRERILIKIASTWEGIRAAEQLEQRGINCNLTLLFGFSQAVACAEAGVFLISPFVGRILDWYRNATGYDYDAQTDPGVLSVKRIYDYYKTHGYKTVVMGASFRNTGEIESLAGCDRLTISPQLLQALSEDDGSLPRQLFSGSANGEEKEQQSESGFRWQMNEDAMATEKLAEGIRSFTSDQITLEELVSN